MNAKNKQTVVINGKTYDLATGKPLFDAHPVSPAKAKTIADIAPNPHGASTTRRASAVSAPTPRKARVVAPHVKPSLQKSTTLRRDILKNPTSQIQPNSKKTRKPVQRSEHITKFSQTEQESTSKQRPIDRDLSAQTKALETAHANHLANLKKQKTPISSRVIKEHLLGKAIEKVPPREGLSHHTPATSMSTKNRFTSVAMTSIALVMLGGYLTYINIPNLSIRIAATNSGINAALPSYQPAGYRIHGPISYSDDEVSINYKQSNNNLGYKISQKPTAWDPIATLNNYVQPDSKNDYQTHSVQGLTVYTYDKKAVWVNGGILHVLAGNAPLPNQQIERIVASM